MISEICGTKRDALVLVGDQEAQADVDERPHEEADRHLRDPVLQEAVEEARPEQRRHHRQHEQRDREDQREHGRDRAHHRATGWRARRRCRPW